MFLCTKLKAKLQGFRRFHINIYCSRGRLLKIYKANGLIGAIATEDGRLHDMKSYMNEDMSQAIKSKLI